MSNKNAGSKKERWLVIYTSSAGNHFRSAPSRQIALRMVAALLEQGHSARIVDGTTGERIYGRPRFFRVDLAA